MITTLTAAAAATSAVLTIFLSLPGEAGPVLKPSKLTLPSMQACVAARDAVKAATPDLAHAQCEVKKNRTPRKEAQ